jgi:hypothetical protein
MLAESMPFNMSKLKIPHQPEHLHHLKSACHVDHDTRIDPNVAMADRDRSREQQKLSANRRPPKEVKS